MTEGEGLPQNEMRPRDEDRPQGLVRTKLKGNSGATNATDQYIKLASYPKKG